MDLHDLDRAMLAIKTAYLLYSAIDKTKIAIIAKRDSKKHKKITIMVFDKLEETKNIKFLEGQHMYMQTLYKDVINGNFLNYTDHIVALVKTKEYLIESDNNGVKFNNFLSGDEKNTNIKKELAFLTEVINFLKEQRNQLASVSNEKFRTEEKLNKITIGYGGHVQMNEDHQIEIYGPKGTLIINDY